MNESRYCTNCGKALSPGARFCGGCGSQIPAWVSGAGAEQGAQMPAAGTAVPIYAAPDKGSTAKFHKTLLLAALGLCIIAILAFFLPFCRISCAEETVARPSAMNAVMGELTDTDGDPFSFEAKPAMILMLILPAAALFLMLMKNIAFRSTVQMTEGILIIVLSIVFLNIAKSMAEEELAEAHGSIGFVLYQIHGWLMLLLGLMGLIACRRMRGK